MKILVIGSGGREHALVWKIAHSNHVSKIFCAPGNAGISEIATCLPIEADNLPALLAFAHQEEIDLTVVGPEQPLSLGIVDLFEKEGLKIFGPRQNAAILESSKVFMKEFCVRHDIPSAGYKLFTDAVAAKKFVQTQGHYPIVIKADGLAAGKGVVVATNWEEASLAIDDRLVKRIFGDAGENIIIEDFMPGEEATFMIVTDGKNFLELETAQDHKRLLDGDKGPNTGGMGAYSPAPLVTKAVRQKVLDRIIWPLLKGMEVEGRLYKGILYAGLMIAQGEPRLVEFNCRFGDPEAQAILFRLESDLVELMFDSLDEGLDQHDLRFTQKPSVCVVMAAEGYPGTVRKGDEVKGLETAAGLKQVKVFHAGTCVKESKYVTNGGRVLGVTALGETIVDALKSAYEAVQMVSWAGCQYRKDIGRRAL